MMYFFVLIFDWQYLHNNYLDSVPSEIADLPLLKTIQIHNNQKMSGRIKEFGPSMYL